MEEARSLIVQAQEQCKSEQLSDSSCSSGNERFSVSCSVLFVLKQTVALEYFATQVEGACQIAERLQTAACLYAANREGWMEGV